MMKENRIFQHLTRSKILLILSILLILVFYVILVRSSSPYRSDYSTQKMMSSTN